MVKKRMIQINDGTYEERIRQIHEFLLEIQRVNENTRSMIEERRLLFPDSVKLAMEKLEIAEHKTEAFKEDLSKLWENYAAEIHDGVEINKNLKLKTNFHNNEILIFPVSEDPLLNEKNSGKPKTKLEISIIKALKSLDIAIDTTKNASFQAVAM